MCLSLVITTTAVVAEPKQSILVQLRKTWVCMIMEGSLSFLKLYCMLQCNQQPSPGAVFEVSIRQCGLDTLVHLFKSDLLDLQRRFWSMIVQIFCQVFVLTQHWLGNVTPSLSSSNRVFTEGTCKLLKLVISDLVDEDFVINRRQQAASALLFGMVALLTKPGQTFAPLIGTWLLCVYTGRHRNAQNGHLHQCNRVH